MANYNHSGSLYFVGSMLQRLYLCMFLNVLFNQASSMLGKQIKKILLHLSPVMKQYEKERYLNQEKC